MVVEVSKVLYEALSIKSNKVVLLDIFHAYQNNDKFSFWVINKHGSPGAENSEFITYEHRANIGDAAEIEAILAEEYNLKEIKD